MKIACTHTGKIGDILYTLPTIRHISKIMGHNVDFWTQIECAPLRHLIEQQSYINHFFINESYVKQHENCGVQPFLVEPIGDYDRIFHLGLREYPQERLVDYYPRLMGFTFCDTAIKYDFTKKEVQSGYVVCPGRNPLLKGLFAPIMTELSKTAPVYQIGPKSETMAITGVTTLNVGFEEVLPYLDNCLGFVGTLSANLVLANGFDCKKVVICEKERRFSKHDIHSSNHIYLDFPVTSSEVLQCVKSAT